MSRSVVIATLQPPLTPSGEDDALAAQAERLRVGAALIEEAGRRGATVVCLPENFTTMGLPRGVAGRLAEGPELPSVMVLAEVAGRYGMTLITGVLRRAAGGCHNSAVVIEDGTVAGIYDKVHPTCEEQRFEVGVIPGKSFPVFNLSWGTVGVLICHDMSFVESARCLALGGAEILFWPHVQSAWGDTAWEAVLRARAIDNGVYVVSSCFSVAEGRAWRPGMMLGRSSIVSPDGTILADAGHHPGMALTTIDLDQPRLAHDFTRHGDHPFKTEMLGDRRPDAYGIITAPVRSVQRTSPASS
jgi:predicted amidohydrolase